MERLGRFTSIKSLKGILTSGYEDNKRTDQKLDFTDPIYTGVAADLVCASTAEIALASIRSLIAR
jgi:hypothetical protein